MAKKNSPGTILALAALALSACNKPDQNNSSQQSPWLKAAASAEHITVEQLRSLKPTHPKTPEHLGNIGAAVAQSSYRLGQATPSYIGPHKTF